MQSASSPFVRFAAEKKTPGQVAALLGCNLRTAKEGLRDGRQLLSERNECHEGATQILLHSALTPTQVSDKRGDRDASRWSAWQDVALGLKRAS